MREGLPYRTWSVTPGKQHLLARTAQHFRPRLSVPVRRHRDRQFARQPSVVRLPCVKTPLARKCRIPQENPAERLLTTARRGTIGARGALSVPKSLTPFEEDCFAGVAKRSDYWPLGDYFHRAWKTPERFSARKRLSSSQRQELTVLPRLGSQDTA